MSIPPTFLSLAQRFPEQVAAALTHFVVELESGRDLSYLIKMAGVDPDQCEPGQFDTLARAAKVLHENETYQVLCLSTAHLTESDKDLLQCLSDDPEEWMYMARKPGFFVKLYSDELGLNKVPGDTDQLQKIVDAAFLAGYRMLEFDRDADALDGFEVYEQ